MSLVKRILRSLVPGMRTRLTAATFLLVSVILGAATFASFYSQKRALQESYEREVRAPLEFVNSTTMEMDNAARALVLVEEFRTRLREKARELVRLQKTVYRKDRSFLNTLRGVGELFGADVKYDYRAFRQKTYFSEYLSQNYVRDLEARVRNRFRTAQGGGIDDRSWNRLKTLAAGVADSERELERAARGLEVDPSQAGPESEKTEPTRKESRRLAAERKLLKKRLGAHTAAQIARTARLKHAIQDFFLSTYRLRLEASGGTAGGIRILSLDTTGEVLFDTGKILPRSAVLTRRLFRHDAFQKDQKAFFDRPFRFEMPEDVREYHLEASRFEAILRPSFQNPATQRRSHAVLSRASDPRVRAMLLLDEQLCAGIAARGAQIRERLVQLQKTGVRPRQDAQFRTLYREYDQLLSDRRRALDNLDPIREMEKTRRTQMNADIKGLRHEIKAFEQEIHTRAASLKAPTKSELDPIETQLQIERLKAGVDDREAAILARESLLDDWRELPEYATSEAIHHLRDAALFEHVYLPYGQRVPEYEPYLRSGIYRETERRRWKALRAWIMAGASESEIGTFATAAGRRLNVLEDGALARSRAEAEEFMIGLDSTPLYGADISRSLAGIYATRSFNGFHLIILDKTEGMRRIRENGQRVLLISGGISVVAAMFAFLFATFAVRRIQGITSVAGRVGAGDLQVSFADSGLDEIGELGRTMNSMVRGLREREEMRGELAAAEEIQKQLLPEASPANIKGRCQLGWFYKAMLGVGGDYYDMLETGPDEVVLCVGDVSNHGVGPALVMALLRSNLKATLRRGRQPLKNIMLELNEKIYADTPPHIFVTFLLARFNLQTGRMEHVSAGHCQPLLWDESKQGVKVLEAGGMPLGMEDNDFFAETIQTRARTIDPGDVFLLYTDGLTEAMTDVREQFGLNRLARTLSRHHALNAGELTETMARAVQKFSGKVIVRAGPSELNDDIAILALKRD